MKIVFVCCGNTCRSPMLAYMFADYLKSRFVSEKVEIISRGLCVNGDNMTDETAEILASNGIKCENHTPKQLCFDDVDTADFIVAVNDGIENEIKKRFRCKAKLLSVSNLTGRDVIDPYGMQREAYETVFEIFRSALPLLYRELFDNSAI